MSFFKFLTCLIFGMTLFSDRINAQVRGEKKHRHRSGETNALRNLRVGKRHSKKDGCSKHGCTEKPRPTGAPSNEPSSPPSIKPTLPLILLMPLRDASDQEFENRSWHPAPIDIDDWFDR